MVSRFNRVQLFATLWTVACQDPLSIQFFRQECWSELPSPLPRDLPDPGIEPMSPVSPALQADSLLSEPGFPGGSVVKNPPAKTGESRDEGKIPGRRKWQPTPVFSPGKFPGQRSLAGYTVHGAAKSQT